MQILVGALALAAFSATPIQALASWLQVYVGATKSGRSVKISPIPDDVNDLTEEIKSQKAVALSHCDAVELNVFAVGTRVPIPDGAEPLDPGETVPGGTTSKKPLIVVAPLPPQQQQDGEWHCCSCFCSWMRHSPQHIFVITPCSQCFSGPKRDNGAEG